MDALLNVAGIAAVVLFAAVAIVSLAVGAMAGSESYRRVTRAVLRGRR